MSPASHLAPTRGDVLPCRDVPTRFDLVGGAGKGGEGAGRTLAGWDTGETCLLVVRGTELVG